MCKLCGPDFQEGREEAIMVAEQLERLARVYRGYASGTFKPHEKDGGYTTSLAKHIVRSLVADFI